MWYSSDGITWTLATASAEFSGRTDLACLVFDGKLWVMGGEDATASKNDVWWSN